MTEKTQPLIINGQLNLDPKPKIYLICGSCSSGKSYLMQQILYERMKQNQLYKFGVISSNTAYTGSYDYIDQKYVWSDLNMEKFTNYIEILKKRRKESNKPLPRNFIIIDDGLGMVNFAHPKLCSFFSTHRHLNTDVYILLQYIKLGTSTLLREIANYAFIFNQTSKRSYKEIFESLGTRFKKEKQFVKYLRKAVKKQYHCLVCFNEPTLSRKYTYCIFKAKPNQPKFFIKF